MSYDIDVFVASDDSLEVFVHQMEELLDTTFAINADWNMTIYVSAAFADEWQMFIDTHVFAGHGDLHFEEFRYLISPHVFKSNLTGDERIDMKRQLANDIFEKLKATGKYHIMLVEQIAIKLKEFNPDLDRG